ncbi:MAG TPA: gamma-glutamylcyclotransferase family protein [Burkholderiales bacterium]|nr:gamma-glutamylcyclotransferase family protein [Burkholderiales bacterium]
MSINVFTYGSLMHPEVMRAVTGRIFACETATLDDHRRLGLKDCLYPGLVACPGHRAEGVLWRDVDELALATLDRFEDDFYERRVVRVQSESGVADAHAWVVRDDDRWRLNTTDWDYPMFCSRDLAGYLRECRSFRRTLAE